MKRLISILAALCVLLAPFGVQAGTTYGLLFTSGGSHEVVVGDTLTGGTSGATAVVSSITLSGGAWTGTAAGQFILTGQTGTFQSETLNEGVNVNVCTVAGDSSSAVEAWSNPSGRNKDVAIVTFTIVAESNGGNIHPIETSSDLDSYTFMATSDPGTVAPTASWDYTFDAEDGADILGGEGADRSATVTEAIVPKIDAAYPDIGRYAEGTGTLTIINNSVNSANIVVKVYIHR